MPVDQWAMRSIDSETGEESSVRLPLAPKTRKKKKKPPRIMAQRASVRRFQLPAHEATSAEGEMQMQTQADGDEARRHWLTGSL